MPRALLLLAIIGLMVYAIADIASSDDDDRLGVPAFGWIVIVVLLPVVGALGWLAVSRSQRARRTGTGPAPTGRPGAQGGAGRPLAPDDDPEFLWRLDQAQRARQRAEQQTGAAGTPDVPPEDAGTSTEGGGGTDPETGGAATDGEAPTGQRPE